MPALTAQPPWRRPPLTPSCACAGVGRSPVLHRGEAGQPLSDLRREPTRLGVDLAPVRARAPAGAGGGGGSGHGRARAARPGQAPLYSHDGWPSTPGGARLAVCSSCAAAGEHSWRCRRALGILRTLRHALRTLRSLRPAVHGYRERRLGASHHLAPPGWRDGRAGSQPGLGASEPRDRGQTGAETRVGLSLARAARRRRVQSKVQQEGKRAATRGAAQIKATFTSFAVYTVNSQRGARPGSLGVFLS